MRSLALAIAILTIQLGFGCTSTAIVASAESPKGPVELTLDKKADTARIVFGDAKYRVHLRGISDSRCPANAKCIWSGELAAEFDLDRDLAGDKSSKRFTLGEVTAPALTILGASLELVSIDERSVKIRVTSE